MGLPSSASLQKAIHPTTPLTDPQSILGGHTARKLGKGSGPPHSQGLCTSGSTWTALGGHQVMKMGPPGHQPQGFTPGWHRLMTAGLPPEQWHTPGAHRRGQCQTWEYHIPLCSTCHCISLAATLLWGPQFGLAFAITTPVSAHVYDMSMYILGCASMCAHM